MLNSLLEITGIGTFQGYHSTPAEVFRRLTLIAAPNGMGKTTLTDVIRSLKNNDPTLILGRRRLGQAGEPAVRLEFDFGEVHFRDGEWSEHAAHLHIFDSTFVNRNIFTGDFVEHRHKKNLDRVILGERGVRLGEEITELDLRSREKSAEIRRKEAGIRELVGQSVEVNAFLTLPKQNDIDSQIREAKQRLVQAERRSEIISQGDFQPLPNISTPRLDALFERPEQDLAAAVFRVKEHLDNITDGATLDWVVQGSDFVKDENCPFCAQKMGASELLQAFGLAAAGGMEEFYNRLSDLADHLESAAQVMNNVTQHPSLIANQNLGVFWSRLGVSAPRAPSLDGIPQLATQLRRQVTALIERKRRNPLLEISLSPEVDALLADIRAYDRVIDRYNGSVADANREIDELKADLDGAEPDRLRAEIALLEVQQIRHADAGEQLCQDLNRLRSEKSELASKKRAVRESLDKYASSVLRDTEARINGLLETFGTDFRLTGSRRSYAGGKPSSSYDILINRSSVSLGNGKQDRSVPSFSNTLSAGDRATLALAFFITSVENDPDLGRAVLVFDDPFTGQDSDRRACTWKHLSALAGRAKQVIVMSHEPEFLKDFNRHGTPEAFTWLELARSDRGGTVLRGSINPSWP